MHPTNHRAIKGIPGEARQDSICLIVWSVSLFPSSLINPPKRRVKKGNAGVVKLSAIVGTMSTAKCLGEFILALVKCPRDW